MSSYLDSALIRKALQRLGELGLEAGIEVELNIYGGSAMILTYDLGRRTRDVDAIFRPQDEVLKLARRVAAELALDEAWLNDDVKQFVAPVERKRELPIEFDGIRIQVPTAAYLLAMKTRAARRPMPGYEGDKADLAFLIRKMEIRSVAQLQAQVDRFFPDEVIPDEKAQFIEEIVQEVWHDE